MVNCWNVGVVNENAVEPVIVNGKTVECIDSGVRYKKDALAAVKEYKRIDSQIKVKHDYVIWQSQEI